MPKFNTNEREYKTGYHTLIKPFITIFKIFIVIYLAALVLSYVIHDLLATVCEIEFPDQVSNLSPLHWELGVLATKPPRKSQFIKNY